MSPEHTRICQLLDHEFSNTALLDEALSHRSAGSRNYERLEFLGDSALNFVIATALYQRKPDLDEGDLSRLRASLVKGTTLARIARELGLGQYLNMGSGELKSGGFDRDSILADSVESLIGAVFIDADYPTCEALILRLYQTRLDNLPPVAELKDPKTRLQEYLQGRGYALPVYDLLKTTGKSHQQVFTVACRVASHELEQIAEGSSRRKAEQLCAKAMLKALLDLKA